MSWALWPRWPPCPCMVTTFKNLFLWNQLTGGLETKHKVFYCYHDNSNNDPGLTLIQIMTLDRPWPILRQGQIWSLMLYMGKSDNSLYLGNYCSLRSQCLKSSFPEPID